MENPEKGYTFYSIGVVHSPFASRADISRERCVDPDGFNDICGAIEIFPEYSPGLKDVEGFSHLVVLFVFHRSDTEQLTARPPMGHEERGVFATRSPDRPNAIGMTVVRLHGIRGNSLDVSGLDMIEGTPVLDIKPYTLRDRKLDISLGWLEPFVNKE
ncbi:MAG: tRNA (N6-threonylcarbamoyladenosine(37)-N6)-methyltransferase TrmO [Acidobacteria bacterium]|nr:tRNA (N6-threonylcarbamoyladenosine(37)-N6)-methyltransferase TrmO [Acidobacteriota bacterium]